MQGFNMGRYVPPHLEGVVSFNQASGKGHALGSRASKLKSQGILIVRFECPFPIWCTTCQPEQIIGQGVRFNAEKKKVGSYYSTPIWSFTIKHTTCGGAIEIRTDPKNTEYVVVSGGRRRDLGTNTLLDGEILLGASATAEEKERLQNEGGFGQLEKKIEDKQVANSQQARINELTKRSDRDWSDPYAMNKRIRNEFRVGRRKRQVDEKSGLALQEKFGIGLDLLAPEENDGTRAKLIEFGDAVEISSASKPLFSKPLALASISGRKGPGASSKKLSNTAKRDTLSSSLQANTRASIDPFSKSSGSWHPASKRKHPSDEKSETVFDGAIKESVANGVLVGYDSDSE